MADDDATICACLELCQSRGWHSAAWALESASGVALREYSEEAAFVRSLIMEGRLAEAMAFIEPLEESGLSINDSHFLMRRQHFFERLVGGETDTESLVASLEPLEALCSPEEFKDLCFCLTLPSVIEHPRFQEWSVHGGRVEVVDSLLPALDAYFPMGGLEEATSPTIKSNQGSEEQVVPSWSNLPNDGQIDAPLLRQSDAVVILSPGCPVRTAAWQPSGNLVAVGTNDRCLHITRMTTPDDDDGNGRGVVATSVLVARDYHAGSVYAAEWGEGDHTNTLATAGNDKVVRLARLEEDGGTFRLQPNLNLTGHDGTVRDVAFGAHASKGKLLSCGAGDCHLRVWDLEEGASNPAILKGHSAAVWSCCLGDSSGQSILSASQDGTVNVWDLRTSETACSLDNHQVSAGQLDPACDAAPWPLSPFLVAATYSSGSLLLWDVRKVNLPVAPLLSFQHSKECRSLHFKGRGLVTSSMDGTAAVHTVSGSDVSPLVQDSYSLDHSLIASHNTQHRVVLARWHPTDHAILTCTDSAVVLWT